MSNRSDSNNTNTNNDFWRPERGQNELRGEYAARAELSRDDGD